MGRIRRWLGCVVLAVLCGAAAAQEAPGPEGLLQIGDALDRFLARQQALGHLPGAHLGARPLSAYEARAYLDSLAVRPDGLTATDRRLLARFRREEAGPGVAWVRRHAPFLYADGQAFLSVREDGYALEAEPLATLSLGRARTTGRGWVPVWQNTRGARAAGHLGRHLFFEGRVEESQWRVPISERERGTAPRLGFVHDLDGAYDYLTATGVVGVRTRFVEARFGRDRNQWGYGAGSVALSSYAPAYDQLQIRTRVWRLHYTNLFAQLVDRAPGSGGVLPRKFAAMHRLAVHLPGRVELALFEQVVFADDTTGHRGTAFDLAYLNPLILYRAVERDIGSPDNVLLGAGAAWNAVPGLRLYGQFVLDEFSARRFTDDWWGNKWGYVVGFRAGDPFGLRDLDVQVEYARLRPYLYAHRSVSSALVHQNDGLGHPAGPNAWDVTARLHWRPLPTLVAALDVAYTRRGRNPEGENFGADPREPTTTRPPERTLATTTLQGVRQEQLLVEARVGVEVLPSLVAEVVLRAESVDDAEAGVERYMAPFVSLRWGLPFQSVRF